MYSVQRAASVSGGWVVMRGDAILTIKLSQQAAVRFCQSLTGNPCKDCQPPCGYQMNIPEQDARPIVDGDAP